MSRRIVDISSRVEFSAAHKLESAHLDESENRALYGPCFNDHGHNYALEATVRGEIDPRTGMVMNLSDLAEILREEVYLPMDHKHLNFDVPFLEGVVTTAENVAAKCFERIAERLNALPQRGRPGCRLYRIRLFESRNNFVEVLAADEPAPKS